MIADRPGAFRLRLRVPTQRGEDPGVVLVEVQVGEPPIALDGCQILELTWTWGASSDKGVVTGADAGSGLVRLIDPNRIFDPANSESAFVGIGTVVRILLNGTVAFRGRIDAIAHDLEMATLSLVDAVAALAAVSFVETSVPAESTSSRITRILNLAAWDSARRDISSGGRALQAGTVSADAWSELVEATRNELGTLWITPDGRVAWRSRTTAWTGGAPIATFGCAPSDAYVGSLTTRGDQGELVNILSAARRGGTQTTVSDATSLALYGRRSHVQNDLELSTDDERDLWQAFYLVRQANPALGLDRFKMRPDAAAIAKILTLQLGDPIRVYDEHHGPTIDRQQRWLGARWAVAPAYIEVEAVVGEDASIKQVARSATLDLASEWEAAAYLAPQNTNPAESVIPINGSFESDLTGWYLVGSPATPSVTTPVDATNAISGTKVLRLVGNPAVTNGGVGTLVQVPHLIPVIPFMTYRVRAYAKRISGTAASFQVVVHGRNAGGGQQPANAIVLNWPANSSGSGLYKEGWYTVTDPLTTQLQVTLYLTGTPAATEVWIVDDISVVGGNVLYGEPISGQPGLMYAAWPAE